MMKRDEVALALFRNTYAGDCADDPTFPDRVWASMNEDQRALYYRQADVALAAAGVT
jgi:hypothetical protein